MEQEFTIQPGERWPRETLMPLPEMSYEQELANTPVPFQNRVDFLSIYIKQSVQRRTDSEIARKLGIGLDAVHRMAERVGAQSCVLESGAIEYEPYVREVIAEELYYQRNYDELAEYVSAPELSSYVGRDVRWIRRSTYALGYYPEPKTMKRGREDGGYPKRAALMLRNLLLHTPPANEHYALIEIKQATGRGSNWIRSLMEKEELSTSLRISATDGRISPHVTQEVFDLIVHASEQLPPPAGDWLTAHRITVMLGANIHWVKAQLEGYKEVAKYLTADNNEVLLHYPPEVYAILKAEYEKPSEYKPPEGRVTEKALAIKMGRTVRWVQNRREFIEQFGDTRKRAGGSPRTYYLESEALAALESHQERLLPKR